MTNATDERAISKKRNRVASDEDTAKTILRTLMTTAEGRRYVWLQLESCQVFRCSFTGDALTSAFREGERNVGLKLLSKVQLYSPNEFVRMLIESSAIDLKEPENGRSDDYNDPVAGD